MRSSLVAIVIVVVAASCGASGTPAPSPSAAPGRPLTTTELRYRLIDQFGTPAFCDPDSYPIGRDEVAAMQERFPEIEREADVLAAIRSRLGIPAGGSLDQAQRLAIYREWKLLNAIVLDGPDRAFSLLVGLDPNTETGTRVSGTISADGAITVTGQRQGETLACPICLTAGTPIATPTGDVRVEDIHVGMTVWSLDAAGRRIEAVVLRIGRTPVPETHRVVRVELADGRSLVASPGHPLADGRPLGSLVAGDTVDGSTVVRAELEPYAGRFTYDLLTSGAAGSYVAGGIVLRSTLGG